MISLLTPNKTDPLSNDSKASGQRKTTSRIFNKLPVLPETATVALRVLNDPACSFDNLVAVVERDPSLAISLVKAANSPRHRVGRTVSTIRLAIERVGLEESRNIISTQALRALENVSVAPREWWKDLWHHSFLTACLCRRLSEALNLNYQGEEFTCGLVHDIGRLLMAISSPETFDTVAYFDPLEGPEILRHERRMTGSDHCYLGAWFVNINQLPAPLSNACQFHHSPADTLEHQHLVALVAVADHMANYIHRESRIEGYVPDKSPSWPLLLANEDGAAKSKCLTMLPVLMAAGLREAQEVLTYLG